MTTLVGTSTAPSANAWPHQRKMAVVGPRLVEAYFDGSSTKFKWSTTGGAQTDYAADIAGAGDLSFAPWQDSGGVWHVIAVWKQAGTGGARTDTWLYVMVGTFSTDLATLTWGAAQALDTVFCNVPDIDVVPDGTGGLAMAVYSQNDPSLGPCTKARRITISALGVMTQEPTQVVLSGPLDTTTELSFPSVAIDPVSKHLGLSYGSAPITGSRQTRFRKATYSAGTWGWGPERVISSSLGSHQNGLGSGIVTCRWDPFFSGWVIGGPFLVDPDTLLEYAAWWFRDQADSASGSGPLASIAVVSTARQTAGTFGTDPTTGNILAVGAHHTSLGNAATLRVRTLVRDGATGTLTDDGYTVLDPSTDIGWTAALAVPGVLHVQFQQGSATPWNVAYVRLALNQAPNAPTLLAPVGGVFLNAAQAQRFTWAFSDPDSGDVQSAFELRYRVIGAGSWTTTGWTAGVASHLDFAGATFSAANYEWQVRTKDNAGAAGPWSSSAFFTGVGAPSDLSILFPPNTGTVGARYDARWSVSAQDSFQVVAVGDNGVGGPDMGTVYFDSGEVLDPATRDLTVTLDTSLLGTGGVVHTLIRAKASGVWGAYEDARDVASFAIPGLVTLDVDYVTRDAFGVWMVTTDRSAALGLRVAVTNLVGDPDPLIPSPDTSLDLHIDAGGPGGDA